jgi:streptogramin lyase
MSGAMCDGLDAIWVSSSRSTVSRIDPRSGAVTQRLHRVAIVQAVGGGSLWGTFADNAGEVVRRIDPGTGRVVAAIRIPHGRRMAFGLGTLRVAQEPRTMTPGGDEPATMKPGKLYRIDPATNRVLGRPVPMPGIGPTALAVGEGAVWAGELDGKALTRFNLAP